MRLFSYELKKLILNRRTLILLAVLFAVYGAIGYNTTYFLLGNKDSYAEYAKLAESRQGPLQADSESGLDLGGLLSALEGLDAGTVPAEGEEIGRRGHPGFSLDPGFRLEMTYTQYTANIQQFRREVRSLEARVSDLKQASDSAALAQARSELARLTKLGEPPFANTVFWDNLLGNIGSGAVLFLLFVPLAYICAPIFAQEAATGMDSLILSSRHGRGKLIGIKLTALAMSVALIIFLYFFSTWLFSWLASGSMAGATAPIRSVLLFFNAPFSMSVWQFFLFAFVWLWGIGLAYACLLCLISIGMRSNLGAFGLGLIVLFLNFVLLALGDRITERIQPLIALGMSKVTSILTVFTSTETWNLFGLQLPYWLAVTLVWATLAVVSILGIVRIQKRKSVA